MQTTEVWIFFSNRSTVPFTANAVIVGVCNTLIETHATPWSKDNSVRQIMRPPASPFNKY